MTLAGRLRSALQHRRLPLVLALIAFLLVSPAVRGGFQLDDHFQRFRLLGHGEPAIQLFVFADGDIAENTRRMDAGWHPWWAAAGFRHASLRYLSVLTMQLDFALWPDRPQWMHVHSLLWLGALVAAAALFYRRILGPTWVAGLAALLYAVDDAHVLPAAYLANRNALIATAFGVSSLVCFARARQGGGPFHDALSASFLALALAAGEMALSVAAYLVSHAIFLDRGSPGARLRALAPNGAVLSVWALAYAIGGFGSTDSGLYREPLADPLAFARSAIERIPLLVMGQWTPLPSDLGTAVAPDSEAGRILWAIGISIIALLVGVLWPLVRRDRVARYFALGTALSLLPVAAAGPQNRLLFFVGLGSMGLLAQLVGALVEGAPPASRLWRVPAWVAAVLFLAAHLVLAPLAAPFWIAAHESASEKMDAAIASVPSDTEIAEQDLILVNPPDYVYVASAIAAVRRVAGKPSARHLRALAGSPTAMEVTRVDELTLRVELADGLFQAPFTRYYRAPERRFAPGDRVELSGFSVEVVDLNPGGDPDTLLFRFAVPLEDRSLRWLVWSDGVYLSWQPPRAGESVRLPAPRGIFG